MRKITDPTEAGKAFQRGEEAGYVYFYNDLYPALLHYAFRIVRDKPIAEDMVANAFIKVWKHHETLNHPKVIKSWMYTTVRNECLNSLLREDRLSARQKAYFEKVKHSVEPAVDYNVIRAEVIREIHQTMEVLPTQCKQIFHLLYIVGLSVRETAELLQLTISTIKNQKARGLSIIRKKHPDLNPDMI